MDNLEESKVTTDNGQQRRTELIADIVQQRRAKPIIDPMEEKKLTMSWCCSPLMSRASKLTAEHAKDGNVISSFTQDNMVHKSIKVPKWLTNQTLQHANERHIKSSNGGIPKRQYHHQNPKFRKTLKFAELCCAFLVLGCKLKWIFCTIGNAHNLMLGSSSKWFLGAQIRCWEFSTEKVWELLKQIWGRWGGGGGTTQLTLMVRVSPLAVSTTSWFVVCG